MSLIGTPGGQNSLAHSTVTQSIAAQSIAGVAAAERLAASKTEKKAARGRTAKNRPGDDVQISSSQAEDAIRTLTGNTEEETADDRRDQDRAHPVPLTLTDHAPVEGDVPPAQGDPGRKPAQASRQRLDVQG